MTLAVFFTFGVSLKQWLGQGLFDREKLIYEQLLKRKVVSKVLWFTYGSGDEKIAGELIHTGRLDKTVEVIKMPAIFNFPAGKFIYSLLVPLIRKKQLKQADVFMANQMSGSWSAVLAKKLFGGVLLIRTGYTLSAFIAQRAGTRVKLATAQCIERIAYKNADIAVVASRQDMQYICRAYNIAVQKVNVLGNYIDTGIFKPMECEKYDDRIIFVGRLTEQKNLFNLLKAISKTNLIVDIYGKGELESELKNVAARSGLNVNFMGIVPNEQLPQVLNKYRYYILPSLYEGMPKTLLEALACGLVCIGTNVAGISEVITDGVNGWLACGTNPENILDAIQKAVGNPSDSISKQAVGTIQSRFSLDSIAEKYRQILNGVKNEP